MNRAGSMLVVAGLLSTVLAAPVPLQAKDLPRAKPEAVGMSTERLAQMLLNGGTLEGKRYVSPKTLGYVTSDHLGTAIATTPLSWCTPR